MGLLGHMHAVVAATSQPTPRPLPQTSNHQHGCKGKHVRIGHEKEQHGEGGAERESGVVVVIADPVHGPRS